MYCSRTHDIPNLAHLKPPAQAMAPTSSSSNEEDRSFEPCDVCKDTNNSVSYCTLCDKKLCKEHLEVCIRLFLHVLILSLVSIHVLAGRTTAFDASRCMDTNDHNQSQHSQQSRTC